MAKGITESDVHGAADALVAVGERPTVERIRAHLGTGSPNTVTRWLETWWQHLGPRLTAQAAVLTMPATPDAVVALAGQWWAQALTAARAEANQALADERHHLDAVRAELDEQARASQAQVARQVAMAEQAQQLQATAEQRFADVQRTCDVQAQHVRGIEDRAHAEIDRARQEVKVARNEAATQLQRLAADLASGREREDQARQALGVAQQDAAAQHARATALEQQLARAGQAPTAARRDAPRATKRASRRARTKAP